MGRAQPWNIVPSGSRRSGHEPFCDGAGPGQSAALRIKELQFALQSLENGQIQFAARLGHDHRQNPQRLLEARSGHRRGRIAEHRAAACGQMSTNAPCIPTWHAPSKPSRRKT